MADYEKLNHLLNDRLEKFGYRYDIQISIPHVSFLTYIESPNIFKVKNLIAVIHAPKEIADNLTSKRFFTFLKQSLLDQYGDAFLWKELEMCFVVLCENQLYGEFKKDSGNVVMAQSSFSLNAMMGTTFVNVNTFDHFTTSTWGLYFSGDHLKTVDQVVKEWCSEQKGPQ